MTPNEFGVAIARIGLKQVEVAILFGVNDRTARRWILGEVPIPEYVEVFLRITSSKNLSIDDLRSALDDDKGLRHIKGLLRLMKKHKISPDEALRLIDKPVTL